MNFCLGFFMNIKDEDIAIILLSCPDKPGIVAEVSNFVAKNSGNILQSAQHQDCETNTFFMRIEFDVSNFAIEKSKIAEEFKKIADSYSMNWKLRFKNSRIKVAIFVSKFDHCLYELLIRNKSGELNCDIVQVISNHKDAQEIAEYFNVPFLHIPMEKDKKAEIEKREIEILDSLGVDLIILARYMQILSDDFVSHYKDRVINIHHSFLPAFVGAKPYHQAFSRGVKIIGATSHYVTADLDEGPIIVQNVENITHKDSINGLILKGKNLEKKVLTEAVKLHLEHRVLVFGNKTIVFS